MIKASKLCLQVAQTELLKDLDFQLEPGYFYGLMGPNGAGKSTLIRLLAGELQASSGSIQYESKAIQSWSISKLAQKRAVLPQRSDLSFDYTVEEVVALGRNPFSREPNENRLGPQAISECMESLQLTPLQERNYLTLSGGEQQRVHLARIMAQLWHPETHSTPRYLLLDEPATGLDLSHQHQILEQLRKTARANTVVLAALHEPNHVASYTDRLLVLYGGKLVASGQTDEILNDKLFEKYFCIQSETLQTNMQTKNFSFSASSKNSLDQR